MTGRAQPPKKNFEFILTFEPKVELSEEQIASLFKENIERIPRTGIYVRRSTNFLTMFLVLDSLENESSFLGLRELPYKLIKKEMK